MGCCCDGSVWQVLNCISGSERLSAVRECFASHGGKLTLEEFLRLMLPMLEGKPKGTRRPPTLLPLPSRRRFCPPLPPPSQCRPRLPL